MDVLTFYVGLLAALGGPPMVALYGMRSRSRCGDLASGLICQAMLLGLLSVVLAVAMSREPDPWSSLGFAHTGLSTLLWAAMIATLFIIALGPILMRLPAWLGAPGFAPPLARLQQLPVWYLALAVTVGGIVEEILYRGFALGQVSSMVGNTAVSAALVVVAYSLAHVPLWGWVPALTTGISGAVLTAAFLAHGDIVANILAHMAVDFVGIVLPAIRRQHARRG